MTTSTEAQRDHDIEVARKVAHKADVLANRLIAKLVEEECQNEHQKTIAAALITAQMITKYQSARLVGEPDFQSAVDKLVAHMTPAMEQEALSIRNGGNNG